MSIRIIGGELRRRRLLSVAGRHTRPSADRLKESVFNILSKRVEGAVVLDLYAGTGALGLEALSRGAAFSLFIDEFRGAVSVIERNIAACGVKNRAKILYRSVLPDLSILRSIRSDFSLVFIDPPYAEGWIGPTLRALGRSHALSEGALIVVEHSPAEPVPEDNPPFRLADRRKYGKTLVSFLDYVV
jgi:16S rRNA (guanine966-N2)-methyltransferase